MCTDSKGSLFTCSDDKRIARLECNCSPNEPESVKYYEGHTKTVNKVAANGNILWSASRDLSIKQVSVSFPSCNNQAHILPYINYAYSVEH